MFGLLRNLYKWYKNRNEKVVKFALLGIDNAGKTTILARLKGEVPEFITPTIGFASETIEQGNYHIKIFDLGGGGNIRSIWSSYYAEIHGAIFVVDSADKNRYNIAREVLHAVLEHPRIHKKPLLIFSNKQDLPEALPSPDISEQLELDKFIETSYNIVSCTGVLVEDGGAPDPNISEGLKWLLGMVDRHFPSLEKRIQSDVAEQAEQDRIEKEEKRKRIEAMRRERELERERQDKEEEEKAKEARALEKGESKSTMLKTLEKGDSKSHIHKERLSTPRKSQSIIEVHTSDGEVITSSPVVDGMGMTRDDFKNASSPLSSSSSPRNPSRKGSTHTLSRSSPRSSSVAPLLDYPSSSASPILPSLALASPALTQTSTHASTQAQGDASGAQGVAFTPRSAWSTASHVPSPASPAKKKLDPLTLPNPSLQGI